MKKEYLYAVIGFFAGVILVWFLTVSAVNGNQYGMMQMMGLRSNVWTGQLISSDVLDSHFIEQMIPHHEDAITMSNLALKKAERSEVKVLAQNIIDSQSKEIKQMKQWYRNWFGKDVPEDQRVMRGHGMMGDSSQNSMHMGIMGDTSDMTRLEQAVDFDKEFVEEMIPHHQMAVMMAQMLKNGTTRPEMKLLAEDIITSQSGEIDTMREWLAEWK